MPFNYRPEKLLGKGSFGEVYRGVQIETGGAVAIKFLLPEQAAAIERFVAEARILQCLTTQKHVVRILDLNLQVARPFIVMEFCDRGSLQDMIGRLGYGDVCRLIGQVASALAAVHDIGAYHRDIKPLNILLQTVRGTRLIEAKLGDFGVARDHQPAHGMLTFSAWGTQGYMAPELTLGSFTPACDVYSLGITAIEVLTRSRNPASLAVARIPEQLRAYLLAMTSENPAHRPTAAQVAEVMNRLAELPAPPSNAGLKVAVGAGVGICLVVLFIAAMSGKKR